MQTSPSTRFLTGIWLLLMTLTIATFSIGAAGLTGKFSMLIVLGITMIKSQMVAHYFMALRQTRLLWRLVMLIYFIIVGGLIALAYVWPM